MGRHRLQESPTRGPVEPPLTSRPLPSPAVPVRGSARQPLHPHEPTPADGQRHQLLLTEQGRDPYPALALGLGYLRPRAHHPAPTQLPSPQPGQAWWGGGDRPHSSWPAWLAAGGGPTVSGLRGLSAEGWELAVAAGRGPLGLQPSSFCSPFLLAD